MPTWHLLTPPDAGLKESGADGTILAKEMIALLEYKFDTQLLIEGEGLDEDAIHDIVVENMELQTEGLHG